MLRTVSGLVYRSLSITITRSRPLAAPLAARGFAWAVIAYFAAQLLLRVMVSDALEIDESEQVLWSQSWAWGYGKQPPLYTWMQALVFTTVGVSVFGLALLKNLMLAATFLFTFFAGRRLMPAAPAALGAASMLLLPQIAWESQRDLTHSVLATTMAAWMLWLVVELLHRVRPSLYVALGLAISGGLLSKYSFLIAAVAWGAAAAWHRDTRHIVLNPWILATVGLVALLCAPHGLWLLDHWHDSTAGTLNKLQAAQTSGPLAKRAHGLGSLAFAAFAFLTPWWLAWLLVFRRTVRAGAALPAPGSARAVFSGLVLRHLAAVAAMLAAIVLAGAATTFKDRWMQPYLFLVPMAVFACLPAHDDAPRQQRAMARVLLVMAVLLLIAVSGRVWVNGARAAPDELNLPGGQLAAALRAQGYDGRTIVAGDQVTAAMLRVHLGARVYAWRNGSIDGRPEGPLLLVAQRGVRVRNGTSIERLRQMLGRPEGPRVQTVTLPFGMARADAAPTHYDWTLTP